MSFLPPPATACWQHREARAGFEVAYFQALADGWRIDGTTAAIEDGQTWVVTYGIQLDATWATRSARITARTARGPRQTLLESDGAGRWHVDGEPARHLDGCLDVDLESSAMTNALPVHRLQLPAGARADAPAAYVRASSLTVERLEQAYLRVTGHDTRQRYDYAAPAFDFTCRLVYGEDGLVLDYPGIAVRAG
ncbi:MAG: putative glycolipid-binding domain-containing protein [Actinobacteria bacterium]|nr:putative glycolipid-binding domain-containing protein [Actinomycetota bacterium]MBO0784985.1 putative glycolipid-binding domain-containing protein [Actinomycetota bacterium]